MASLAFGSSGTCTPVGSGRRAGSQSSESRSRPLSSSYETNGPVSMALIASLAFSPGALDDAGASDTCPSSLRRTEAARRDISALGSRSCLIEEVEEDREQLVR